MQKKIFSIFLMACLGLFLPRLCFAGELPHHPVHKLNYFQSKVVQAPGNSFLCIEIGMDHGDLEYKVSKNENKPKQLIIDLQNTEMGQLRPDITLDGKLARYMTFRELERRHTQVMVSFAGSVETQGYRVYTLPADRKSHKPFRLVIEVQASSSDFLPSQGKVKGVTGKTIVLDPGHGGSDSGAIGRGGTMEKDVTLAVSKKVRAILENSGAQVVMTRTGDTDVYGINATDRQELQARVNVGLYTPGADLFLSIHANSFSGPSAHGTETYYYAPGTAGERLAGILQDAMVAAGHRQDRGARQANFYVIKHAAVPSALVELAFISNPEEENLLRSPVFQDNMALAIAQGLGRFFQNAG